MRFLRSTGFAALFVGGVITFLGMFALPLLLASWVHWAFGLFYIPIIAWVHFALQGEDR